MATSVILAIAAGDADERSETRVKVDTPSLSTSGRTTRLAMVVVGVHHPGTGDGLLATWWTLFSVGMPDPMSRNWRMPASRARYRTARPRKARFARMAARVLGGSATYGQAHVRLPPGTVIALYTDGLVETRTRPFDPGILGLRSAMSSSEQGPLEDMCDVLIRALAGQQEDDITVVLARIPA
jgi:hypothetical protein